MLREFKEFALKGNVVDLAIGVIIGAAFGKIVESLVADIFMPIVGAFTGGLDFSNYFVSFKALATGAEVPPTYAKAKELGATLGYGQFLTVAINFAIIAFILFLIVKAINHLKREEAGKAPPPTPAVEVLLAEIRDLLKSREGQPN